MTNDDGIESEGLHVLAAAVHAAGHEVVVVAPDRDWSGASAALGPFRPDDQMDVRPVHLPATPDVEAWAIDGPPGLAVLTARLGAFGAEPDLVVSGINPGANTGRAVIHSGTVGAVLTGQNLGWSGLAVSVQSASTWHWDTAAALTVETLPLLVDAPARSVLNLNAPARPRDEVKGVRWARLAPFGEVRAAVTAPEGGRLQFKLESTSEDFAPDTDSGMVRDGYASLTALVGVVEAWPSGGGLIDEHPEMAEGVVPGAPLHEVHRLPGEERTFLRRPTATS